MSLDRESLAQAVAAHGRVARVVVVEASGSTPREVGAEMLVWEGGQSGSIGGGALEWEAARAARQTLEAGRGAVARHSLGPALGQCCGGSVALATECFDAERLEDIRDGHWLRLVVGRAVAPLALQSAADRAGRGGASVETRFQNGWLLEPVIRARRPLWIYGAGHVGRALVRALAPLEEFAITWIDESRERFPEDAPADVAILPAANPADAVRLAPEDAEHLVLTRSHALDLEICHRLLGRNFRSLGLIGSKTKLARFVNRLGQLGHGPERIARIRCPIGDPSLGKHPQAIAIGVAAGFLLPQDAAREAAAGLPAGRSAAPLLDARGMTKAYSGALANDDVGFSVASGEIHALLGENGAGKSTLVRMIYGLVRPDAGVMTLGGALYEPRSPRQARQAGVAMAFQHFSLFEALSVAENLALGMDRPPRMRSFARRIREIGERYGLPLDPGRLVGELSAGERQRVEIVRCLLQDPKLLIMDEPTSVLTPQEAGILFETLRKLSAEGVAIVYISHKLEEIRALCDVATILRRGKVAARCDPRGKSARELAELMVGKSLRAPFRDVSAPGKTVLAVEGLSIASASPFGASLKDVALRARAGEILGIGGVAGNGQGELLAALSGETASSPDAIRLNGRPIGHLGPDARRRLGLLAAPEERLGHAAAPDMTLVENALLTGARRERLIAAGGFEKRRASRAFAERIMAFFDVRATGPDAPAGSLSGGNLQKFVIGREILQRPACLVANQPTWGVDAAAAAAIRQAILDLAEKGAAVVVISQDLDELMEISDTFAALNEGRLSAPRATRELTMDEIGLMLGGARDMEAAHA